MTRPAADWLDEVLAAERHGELLTAFDLAERGLEEHPGDPRLRYRAVLALARSGSTEEAARRFEHDGLVAIDDEDVQALGARIAKDRALWAEGAERRRLAAASTARYEAVHRRFGGAYPAVNAATLHRVAGDGERAAELARAALAAAGGHGYYAAATRAEALLLLGDADRARPELEAAVAAAGDDDGALATTRRQLRLVCTATGTEPALLDLLAGPSVAHFCGHREVPEAAVAAGIAAELDAAPVSYAYGALAGGADILWAEALLERGAELHVVLPCGREAFAAASVAPRWAARFRRCLDAAASVRCATEDAVAPDDVLFRYGAELAMGLALMRARFLDADAVQLAVWDGTAASGAAGTAVDVAVWRAGGRSTVAIAPDGSRSKVREVPAPALDDGSGRVVRAMLFCDVAGFSRLTDEQTVRFNDRVLGALAAVLDRRPDLLGSNSWGDAVTAVFADAGSAATCALELQAALGSLDLAAEGLAGHLALRLGAHLGPVFTVWDPVRRLRSHTGSHVSRTARIEPVTPPGAVYVTEAFAAALLVAGRGDFACDYVGHLPAAKGYGRLRMHRLRRTAPSSSGA
jgi:hypothetical protein